MAAPPLDPRLHAQLVDIVGAPHVLVDPEVVAGYVVDWTRRFHGDSAAVIRPGNAAEVAATLSACRRAGVAVVPQGGNTGLVAGAIAYRRRAHAVVDSPARNGNRSTRTPGRSTSAPGRRWPTCRLPPVRRAGASPSISRRAASATIGGMTATNAGGLHVIRWGPMRNQLTGIAAATTAGTIVGDQRGLLKDNTGYHLPSILCGSEGTLAVVTSARLRLVAPTAATAVALLAFSSVDDAGARGRRCCATRSTTSRRSS